MADIDEDEAYSDDDIDGLASDDFETLQQHILLSTQGPQARVSLQQGNVHYRLSQGPDLSLSSDYGDHDLDDEVFDGGQQDNGIETSVPQLKNHGLSKVIDEATLRESWRQQRYGTSAPPQQIPNQNGFHRSQTLAIPQKQGVDDTGYHGYDNEEDMIDAPEPEANSQVKSALQIDATGSLQTKVEELLRDRETLQQAVKTANDTIIAKTGEISIVRANQAKVSLEYERQMEALRKSHADAATRQKAEVDAARVEKEKIITEIKYLKLDLSEESARAKQFERAARSKVGGGAQPSAAADGESVGTPRKNIRLPFRDGFNDDEIVFKSPSKGGGKTKVATPKAGAKRKRKAVDDSPGQPLQLSQPKRDPPPETGSKNRDLEMTDTKSRADLDEHQRFQITQKILNHQISHNSKRTFEILVNFSYPSQPTIALSSLFLDQLASLSKRDDVEDFSAALALIVVSLWSQCINEKYYHPVYLLMDMVKFILLISPFTTAAHLADSLVPLAQLTADINVIPRFKHRPVAELSTEVDTNECLQVLYLTASGCARRPEDIQRFWHSMRFDFVFMLLDDMHTIEDLEATLGLLRTSAMEASFAMRLVGKPDQSEKEGHIIDRLTALLIKIPRATPGEQPYTAIEIAEFRLNILSLMEKISDNQHGGEALARNKMAIGRLVRVMNDELSALYHHDYGHEHRAELINLSTRLLFHLLSAYPSLINIQEKLQTQPGGSNKFLIALTRLAFSESIFYERGIDADVCECAHQMLEDYVTPEEGEALCEAFSSSSSSGSRK